MKNKTGFAAILGILIIVVLVSGCTDGKNNQTTQLNTSNTTETPTVKAVDVTAKMTGPSTAKKGSSVTINCVVTNKGSKSVKNVMAHTQGSVQDLGTLNAGQTKNFNWNVYIPTDEEVKQDFGDNATVSNPFYIGGFAVTFTDSNGSKHTINSNSLEIKLV